MAVLMELGDSKIPIEDFPALFEFIEQERGKWSWIQNAALPNVSAHVNGQFADMTNVTANYRNQGQAVHVAVGEVQGRLNSNLIYSGSPEGIRVLDILSSLGEREAGAAYSVARNLVNFQELRDLGHLRGLIAFAFPALAPVDSLIKDLTAERQQLRRNAREYHRFGDELRAQQESAVDGLGKRGEELSRRVYDLFVRRVRQVETQRTTYWRDERDQVRLSLEAIETTKKTFEELMRLKAPVQYWTDKANKHRVGRRWTLAFTVLYFLAAIGGLTWAFISVGQHLLAVPNPSNTVLFVAGAGLATVSGLLLWVGRIITRLYLSSHHLLHDAEERAVMTNTYLALSHEAQATPEERHIILTALFRATSDGVVKDDAAPDMSIASLIARVGAGPSKP